MIEKQRGMLLAVFLDSPKECVSIKKLVFLLFPMKYTFVGQPFLRGAEKRIFCGCASKASRLAEWRFAFPLSLCARRSRAPPENAGLLKALLPARKRAALLDSPFCVAQRRGFEPPDESPPSHDFQSCSLNHSDISAKAVVIVSYSCEKGNCFCASFAKNSREILAFERLLHALPYIGLRSVRPSK